MLSATLVKYMQITHVAPAYNLLKSFVCKMCCKIVCCKIFITNISLLHFLVNRSLHNLYNSHFAM